MRNGSIASLSSYGLSALYRSDFSRCDVAVFPMAASILHHFIMAWAAPIFMVREMPGAADGPDLGFGIWISN